ncbi:MAG: preprotein translocase subunit SecG [Planctomycetota bacterium]|jgi:preprotein translocase subunit SecG
MLSAVTFFQAFISVLFILICVFLMIVILLQKGRGGGLSGAFGGVGGHSAFGAKTGDVFTWITVALTFLFVLVAIIGVFIFVPPAGSVKPQPEITEAAPSGESVPDSASPAGNIPASQPGG